MLSPSISSSRPAFRSRSHCPQRGYNAGLRGIKGKAETVFRGAGDSRVDLPPVTGYRIGQSDIHPVRNPQVPAQLRIRNTGGRLQEQSTFTEVGNHESERAKPFTANVGIPAYCVPLVCPLFHHHAHSGIILPVCAAVYYR